MKAKKHHSDIEDVIDQLPAWSQHAGKTRISTGAVENEPITDISASYADPEEGDMVFIMIDYPGCGMDNVRIYLTRPAALGLLAQIAQALTSPLHSGPKARLR